MSKLKHQHYRSLTIACVACTGLVLLLHLFSSRYADEELKRRDALARFGKKCPADPDIIFLAIDDASVTLDMLFDDEIDQSPALQKMRAGYPYPRDVYPFIIERLVQAGAKVVAFDILFPQEKETDGPFREALAKYQDKVVIGANLESRDQGARAANERNRHTPVLPAKSLIPSANVGDPRIGFVNFWADADGIVRRSLFRTTAMQLDPPEGLDVNALPPGSDSPPMLSLGARILQKMGKENRIPPQSEPVLFRFAIVVAKLSFRWTRLL